MQSFQRQVSHERNPFSSTIRTAIAEFLVQSRVIEALTPQSPFNMPRECALLLEEALRDGADAVSSDFVAGNNFVIAAERIVRAMGDAAGGSKIEPSDRAKALTELLKALPG